MSSHIWDEEGDSCIKCNHKSWMPDCECPVGDNVIGLDERRPHIVVNCGSNVRVLPKKVLEDIVDGRLLLTDVDGWEDISRVMAKGMLQLLESDA